jgi:hypothetical protein
MLCAVGGQLEQVGGRLGAIGQQQGQRGGYGSGLRIGDDVSGRVRHQVGICFRDVPGVGDHRFCSGDPENPAPPPPSGEFTNQTLYY